MLIGWLEQYSGTISNIENAFIDEVGIKYVEIILNLLRQEFSLRPKERPKTLEEL